MIYTGQKSWGRCEISTECFVEKPEGKIRLGLRLDGSIILKWIFIGQRGVDWPIWLRIFSVAGSCQADSDAWNEILGGEFFL